MIRITSVLQRKTRERDRIYRVGGDEFAVIFSDFTADEAAGSLTRACIELAQKPVRWVDATGKATEFVVSISVGVEQCATSTGLEAAFERADLAAYASKNAGKARVTRAGSSDERTESAGKVAPDGTQSLPEFQRENATPSDRTRTLFATRSATDQGDVPLWFSGGTPNA